MSANATVPVVTTLVKYGTAGSGTATTVLGDVDEVTEWPGMAADEYDTTRVSQTSLTKQNAPSLVDPGQFGADIAMVAADVSAAVAIQGVLKDWEITFEDGSTYLQTGWLKSFKFKGNKGDEVVFSCVIRFSDDPTFTEPG